MPVPRVFVSSTCYDLQEIRNNLRSFIDDFSYEPVMSEFGDIFYQHDSHVHDSCLKEIEKAQMFVLIVGNYYGSIYHEQESSSEIPDSITLREFEKSISTRIPKHVFINKFVEYDYKNYRKALVKELTQYFEVNEVEEENIQETKRKIKDEFDSKYIFAHSSYQYIFHFLDIIHDQKTNNAIYEFESFNDIKHTLKKQWAGYVYEKLTNDVKETSQIDIDQTIKEFSERLKLIENLIRDISSAKKSKADKITLDVEKIDQSITLSDIGKTKEVLEKTIQNILYISYGNALRKRLTIRQLITPDDITNWLKDLDNIIKKYKWSTSLPVTVVFKSFNIRYKVNYKDINMKNIMDLHSIFNNLQDSDIESFANSIKIKFDDIVEVPEPEEAEAKDPFLSELDDDEIPF